MLLQNALNLIIFLFLVFSVLSCRSNIERKLLKVVEIVNGNTIKLENGYIIEFAGIQSSEESFRYLITNVLAKKVQVSFDRKIKISKTDKYRIAYVQNEKKHCINSYLLISGKGEFNSLNVKDSASVYRMYASGVHNYPHGDKNNNSELSLNNRTRVNSNSFISLVNQIEKSVFLIFSDDGKKSKAQGSGFFINGKIGVSNYHVVAAGKKFYIKTHRDEILPVTKWLKFSEENDFVIFEVDGPNNYPYLKKVNSLPEKGEEIFVIGNPRGLESTVTKGIVSALRTFNSTNDFIQFDAAISPGSSGSPVLNMRGEVLGIATMKLQECENCNFAVNINLVY